MRSKTGLGRGAAALVAVLCASPALGQGQSSEPLRMDAVTVTANKRPQRLGEVDGSVTVRTAEDLERAHVTKVDDLGKVFPGLIINERGNRAYANITVRGVTSPDFYNPAVQVYVDGVPQDAAYFTQQLLNVDRVELLRGPQGTLYGRNAHGGVINIITRKPDDKLEGNVGGTLADKRQNADASVATPIVPGKLFGDINVRWEKTFGQVDDIATGQQDIDDAIARLGRARLRYAPIGGPLDVMAMAQREEVSSHEELYIREVFLRDRNFNSATQGGKPFLDRAVNTFALNADYDLGFGKISSVTSSQNRKLTRVLQGRNTPEDQDGLAQELRFAYDNGGRLTGVAGAFIQDTDFTRRDPGFTGFFGPSQNNVDSRSYALFGEATYKITESVDATAGLRWSREDAEIDYARTGTSAFSFKADDSFSDVSPKGALGWEFAPRHRLYGVVARGFKPGGFNHTVSVPADAIPYESETSTNYEIGWRGIAFGGAVEFGTAVYWIKAKDKQIYVGPLGQQVLRNVGDAESKGVEFDMTARPIDSLVLTLGGSFGRSEFDGAVDPQTGANYDGNTLPYAPDYTVQGSARYIVPQTSLAGELSLRGAATYVSKTYFNETNTLGQGGYTLLDVSLDVNFDSGLSLSLFADNLTDKLYRTSSFLFAAGDQRSTIGDGRIVGLAARMKF